jgi:hypothetical protein
MSPSGFGPQDPPLNPRLLRRTNGWLMKRSGGAAGPGGIQRRNWKRRFFVIKPQVGGEADVIMLIIE